MRIPPGSRRVVVGLAAVTVIAAGVALAVRCERPEIVTGRATLRSTAGTVDVECVTRNRVRIVGSAADPGYSVRMIVSGPSAQASLIFENPKANDVRVAVRCEGTRPVLTEFEVEDTTLAA